MPFRWNQGNVHCFYRFLCWWLSLPLHNFLNHKRKHPPPRKGRGRYVPNLQMVHDSEKSYFSIPILSKKTPFANNFWSNEFRLTKRKKNREIDENLQLDILMYSIFRENNFIENQKNFFFFFFSWNCIKITSKKSNSRKKKN